MQSKILLIHSDYGLEGSLHELALRFDQALQVRHGCLIKHGGRHANGNAHFRAEFQVAPEVLPGFWVFLSCFPGGIPGGA